MRVPGPSIPFDLSPPAGTALTCATALAHSGASPSITISYLRLDAVSSSIVPCAATRPCTMIAMRSLTISSSLSRCEFTNTVRPCARSCISTSRISRRPTGSTPSVGSSSTTSSGSFTSAAAIPVRWRMPLL